MRNRLLTWGLLAVLAAMSLALGGCGSGRTGSAMPGFAFHVGILVIIGIFLPLLPTTPFLPLTAALYVRSSPRLYNRLLHHKYLGSYIRNFRENKAIPLRAKIISVSLIWITILNCIFFIVPYWWLKAVLLLIAAGTSYHILSFKTLK